MHYVNAHVLYQLKILPRPFWLLFAETKPLLNSVQKLLFQQRVDEYIHQFSAMTLSFSYSNLKQRPLDEIYTCIRKNQMTSPHNTEKWGGFNIACWGNNQSSAPQANNKKKKISWGRKMAYDLLQSWTAGQIRQQELRLYEIRSEWRSVIRNAADSLLFQGYAHPITGWEYQRLTGAQ